MRKERKGQMPFTSEAVVAHWRSLRNIIFLSPCRGLHPEHPRSCGVSNKIAWRGVFINAEIWPTETTYPSAHTHNEPESSSLAAGWDLWPLQIASFFGNEGKWAPFPALCCFSGYLLERPKQRRASWSKLGLITAVQSTKTSLLQQGSPANGPWLTDYQQRLSNRLLI